MQHLYKLFVFNYLMIYGKYRGNMSTAFSLRSKFHIYNRLQLNSKDMLDIGGQNR